LQWGEYICKVDCSNHVMKNFTNYIKDWKKNNKVKTVNGQWCEWFSKTVHKLIKEKV
jgi:hypothetical protein